MFERLTCRVRGHEWSRRPRVPEFNPDAVVGECDRCGEEATFRDVAYQKALNRGPPSSLLDQDPEEEIQAAYRDGKIDEEELEYLLEKTLSSNGGKDE